MGFDFWFLSEEMAMMDEFDPKRVYKAIWIEVETNGDESTLGDDHYIHPESLCEDDKKHLDDWLKGEPEYSQKVPARIREFLADSLVDVTAPQISWVSVRDGYGVCTLGGEFDPPHWEIFDGEDEAKAAIEDGE